MRPVELIMNMQMSQPASVLRYLIAGMLEGGGTSALEYGHSQCVWCTDCYGFWGGC